MINPNYSSPWDDLSAKARAAVLTLASLDSTDIDAKFADIGEESQARIEATIKHFVQDARRYTEIIETGVKYYRALSEQA